MINESQLNCEKGHEDGQTHGNGPRHEITCFCHMRSAFVVRCLDSIISTVAISEFSRLQLVSVAEQAGLSLTWSQTPEDMFSHDEGQIVPHLQQ